MRRAARAVIIRDNKLLVIFRNKFGLKYVTLPGGRVEIGETPEQALYRELAEETTINFENPRLIILEHAGQPYGDQYVFLCDYKNGEPLLHPESEEAKINQLGQNLYRPGWLAIQDLPQASFRSEELKQMILKYLQEGWPKDVHEMPS